MFRLKGAIVHLSFVDLNGLLIPPVAELWKDASRTDDSTASCSSMLLLLFHSHFYLHVAVHTCSYGGAQCIWCYANTSYSTQLKICYLMTMFQCLDHVLIRIIIIRIIIIISWPRSIVIPCYFVFSSWDFYSLGHKKIIIITDLYSTVWSEDTEALYSSMELVTWKPPGLMCGWVGRILRPDSCISGFFSDPKHFFYLSGLLLCLSIDHFCFVPVDDMVLFHGMVCDDWLMSYTRWFTGHVLHRAVHSRQDVINMSNGHRNVVIS